jgi:hypothetical protein
MSESSSDTTNRRQSYRRRSKAEVQVSCHRGEAPTGPNLALGLLDASQTGVCLAVREALSSGDQVCVCLEGPAHPRLVRRGTAMPYRSLIRLTEL